MLRRSTICRAAVSSASQSAAAAATEVVRKAIQSPICIVGYGNIGRGILPLLERHFSFDPAQLHVVEPLAAKKCALLPTRWKEGGGPDDGYKNIHALGLTEGNFKATLDGIFGNSKGGDAACGTIRGFVVNCSVDTSSVELARYAQSQNLIYLDTVVEPWQGYYWNKGMTTADRSNYALREGLLALKRSSGGRGSTCISCVGANPGMVSWFVKDALMQLATDLNHTQQQQPTTREGWAALMHQLGVKGVHIAERDTQYPKAHPKPVDEFWNTWSVEGFLSEGFQPSELGWGTHETWFPENGKRHAAGSKASIYLEQPGANTRVRTWCPSLGPQTGYLVTHNESISIADYFTVGSGDKPTYRPTVHYAYHPCDAAVMSFHECFGRGNVPQTKLKVMLEGDIGGGQDELGVLLYGHAKNALWLGSTLTHDACAALVKEQNATALQVTSAMLAAMTWAMDNSQRGVLEAEDLDHDACLKVQKPYLGKYWHQYTDWTPLDGIVPSDKNASMFAPPKRTNTKDPWQFSNVLV